MTKVIRVDWETYKIINDYANKGNINIGDATRLLVERGLAGGDALLKERDTLRYRIREIIDSAYGKGFADELSTDEELLSAIENLVEVISAKDKREEFLHSLLACSVCGKFDFDLTPEAVKAIKALLAQAGWGHSSCIRQRKT